MIVRLATPDDAAALVALGRASFCAAFEHLYEPRDIRVFLEEAYAPALIAREIADPGITHCVTQDQPGGAITAFIKLRNPSPYAGHSNALHPLGLNQLYTAPGRTGEGLGTALMRWALAQAGACGHDAIQLSVWSENFSAQRFYQRFGFAKIADIGFWVGQQRDDEFLFERRF